MMPSVRDGCEGARETAGGLLTCERETSFPDPRP